MMSARKIHKSVPTDEDRSPVCKRARYDVPLEDTERWTLSKNEVILHSIYDSGVDRLASDREFDLEREMKRGFTSETPTTKIEQIAILEASLPENTLIRLSLGELDNILSSPERNSSLNSYKSNYFEMLSDEVILNIFQKLPKSQLSGVALVCRRFSQLVEDESLWTRMDASNRTLEPGAFGAIMSRQVVVLKMSRTKILTPTFLPNSKAFSPDYRSRLMYLDLTMAGATVDSLKDIFDRCKRLKKLSLESVPVNDGVLVSLAENRNLEVLNLAMCTGVGVEGLRALLSNCLKLRELNLAWTYLNGASVSFVCENLPKTLDRFNFSGCRKLLHDESVVQIIKNCPNLRELDFSDCTAITGEAVKKLTVLNELNFLSLSRCYLIPSRSLLCLKRMKNLAYLDIHGSYINADELKIINEGLGASVNINKFKFSSIARPTVGLKKSRIWEVRVRD